MIEKELLAAELANRNSRLQSDYGRLNNILKFIYEYLSYLGKQVCNFLIQLRQRNFEFCDKPHMLLARQLKGELAK